MGFGVFDEEILISVIVLILLLILVIFFVERSGVLGARIKIVVEHVPVQRLLNGWVIFDLRQPSRIDRLTRLFLSHDPEDTIVEMLIKVLSVTEGVGTCRALPRSIGGIVGELLRSPRARHPFAAVRRRLLHPMDGCQMTLEDICTVETLLRRRARAWAKATHHRTFVMGKSVSILVIFAGKALLVVVARHDGTFLWTFQLVCQHVSLEILEHSSTVSLWASPLFGILLIHLEAARSLAA